MKNIFNIHYKNLLNIYNLYKRNLIFTLIILTLTVIKHQKKHNQIINIYHHYKKLGKIKK